MGWVFDLQCHDPDARLVTYLLPNGVQDDAGNANLPGPAQLHLWRDGALTAVDAGEARAAAVDGAAGRFYAITGEKGKILETRDLTGRLIQSERLPGTHIGWRLALSPDRSELAVLALSKPLDRGNWYYALVDRLLVFDLATGRMDWHPLPAAGFALLLQADDSGFVAAVGQYEVSPVTVDISRLGSRVAGEATKPVASLPIESRPESGMVIEQPGPLAVGSEAVIFTATSEGILGQVNAWAYDLTTRGETAVEGLVWSRLAIPLPPGTEITNLPPLSTTTTTAPGTTTSVAAPSTCTTAPFAEATTTTSVAASPGSAEDAEGRWVQIALIAAAVVLAASGVAVVAARASGRVAGRLRATGPVRLQTQEACDDAAGGLASGESGGLGGGVLGHDGDHHQHHHAYFDLTPDDRTDHHDGRHHNDHSASALLRPGGLLLHR